MQLQSSEQNSRVLWFQLAGSGNRTKKRKSAKRNTEAVTQNKTRTSKDGAISKAQKAQNIFLEKNLKFSTIFFFGKCRQCRKM